MKRVIIILAMFVVALGTTAGKRFIPWSNAAVGPTYLINQNFETTTTGYDNGETWTEAGTVNPSYSTYPAPLLGTQSLRLGSNYASSLSPEFTGKTDIWAYAIVRATDYWSGNATDLPVFSIMKTDNTILAAMYVKYAGENPNGGVSLYANGGISGYSSTVLARSTTYYVWLHYVQSGTCELFISTTTTRPTVDGSGAVYLTKTGGTGTATKVALQNPTDAALIFDHVLASGSAIGNNP